MCELRAAPQRWRNRGESSQLGSRAGESTTRERNMCENSDFDMSVQDSKAAYVLSNVAEVVERILTFVPTKSLLRIARCVCLLDSEAS